VPLSSVTEHTVTPLTENASGNYIEGEADVTLERGRPFPGVLFLPATQQLNRMGRQVTKPTLMYETSQEDDEGEFVAILRSGDRVGIVAEEQNIAQGLDPAAELVWVVDGTPQPLGRPGDEPKAIMVAVRAVED
jgi:hypothetical protein